MRQVPYYLIIGNGRMAQHFRCYLSLLNIPFLTWDRQKPLDELQEKITQSSHVLLLISDDAIELFITQYLQASKIIIVHFSGSLITEKAYGAHPLMTFNSCRYDLARYQSIPFILDHDAPPFDLLLPGLSNDHWHLHKSLKAKYHALCVLSGNFSCMLWQKLMATFAEEFNLPSSIAHAYLQQQTQNIINNYETALTGPVTRHDRDTINKNIAALDSDPFQSVYESFVLCYQQLDKKV